MTRLVFVATLCLIFAAAGVHSLNVRKLDTVGISGGSNYNSSRDENQNTFGLKALPQESLGIATVSTGHFESGPQHLVTSNFKCETFDGDDDSEDGDDNDCSERQYYENVEFSRSKCVALNNAAGSHVVGYKSSTTNVGKLLNCPNDFDEYCDSWETSNDAGAFAQTDYCYDMTAPEVIDNLLCTAEKDTSAEDPGKLALTGSVDHKFDWCTTSTYSKREASNPAVSFDQTQFQIEDYDVLDQQCFTTSNSEKDEFTHIVCDEANHRKYSNDEMFYYAEMEAALQQRARHDDPNVSSWRNAANSRYPNQEYCMDSTTLLTELFGCADDQRESCDGDAPEVKECAGNLDQTMVDHHSDYLDWDPTNMKNNYYGNSQNANYRCTVPEIAIANALSAYLDKADLDITTVCSQAKTRFQIAYKAYIDFVDPNKFDEVVDGQTKKNLYTVLRAAWRQAEFTLRSAKIQQQTLDRMRKYQDLVESVFASGEQGLADAPDVDSDGYRIDNANFQTASQAFRDFRTAWDGHVQDYIQLSRAETTALVADLQTAVDQIVKAKQFAQEVAATQISAASALASVSVHFRKKLKLWMNIEHVLETRLNEAFTAQQINVDGENEEHAFSNMATTAEHQARTSDFSITKARIGEGEAYNGNGQDRNDENIDIAFTNGYEGNPDADNRLVQITMSDGSIVTTKTCSSAADCTDFNYNSATNPAQNRIATCNADGKCVLPATSVGGSGMNYTDNGNVQHAITASMANNAGNTTNKVHGTYLSNGYRTNANAEDHGPESPRLAEIPNSDRSSVTINRIVDGSVAAGDANADASPAMCLTKTINDCPDQGNAFNIAINNANYCANSVCDFSAGHEDVATCCTYTALTLTSSLSTGNYGTCNKNTGNKTRSITRSIIPESNNRGYTFTINDVPEANRVSPTPSSNTSSIATYGVNGDAWTETEICPVDCELSSYTCGYSSDCIVRGLNDVESGLNASVWATRLLDENDVLWNEAGNYFPRNGGLSCQAVLESQAGHLEDDPEHHCLGCHDGSGTPQLSRVAGNTRSVDPTSEINPTIYRSSDTIQVRYFGVISGDDDLVSADNPDGYNNNVNLNIGLVGDGSAISIWGATDLCGPADTNDQCIGSFGKPSGWCRSNHVDENGDPTKPCIIGKYYTIGDVTTTTTATFTIRDSGNGQLIPGASATVTIEPRVCGNENAWGDYDQLPNLVNGVCTCTAGLDCNSNCPSVNAANYTDPLDECGVCNGNGIPAGDCDCDGNQNDALGVCGGPCAADADSDGLCDDVDNCVDPLITGICTDNDGDGCCAGAGAGYDIDDNDASAHGRQLTCNLCG